ncbi:MAG: hypothetical protein E6R06_30425, partial [Mycobacterium sp.]
AGEARPTGSVRHVEVFRMRSVGTLIFERPRPLSRQRRANHLYTLICEEPYCNNRPIVRLACKASSISRIKCALPAI